MTFLPIIERELRARARRQATYWARVAVGGFGALLCLMQLSFGSAFAGTAAVGQYAFLGLVTAAFLLCCGACLLTADTISSERREGTLGLLFLTRVRGNDVLLGKLGAAGMTGLCAVIVFLPVLMIPVLSGGVTGGEAFRKGLVLLNTLFVGLTCGLLASAEGETRLGALRRAVVLMTCILFVPAPFYLIRGDLSPLSHLVAAFSPFTSLLAASDAKYRVSPAQYWEALILLHLLGWGLLWQASVVLRRSLREPLAAPEVSDMTTAQQDASPVTRWRLKPFTKQTKPIDWLVTRQPGLSLAVWAGVAIGVSYWLIIPFAARFLTSGLGFQALLGPISLVAQAAKGGLFAWVASRFFIEARRTGELELLVTTPLGAAALVSAQWEMLRRLFRWPIIVLLVPIVLQVFSILAIRSGGMPGTWKVHYAISTVLAGINTWIGIVALCWVGMWFGLRARSQSSAIVWTVGLVGLLPYLLSWLFSLAALVISRFLSNTAPMPVFLSSTLSRLFILGFFLWLIHRTKKLLSGDLRLTELQPLALTKSLGALWRDGWMVLRRARHWTPS